MSCRRLIVRLLGAAVLVAASGETRGAEPQAVRRAIEAAYGVEVLDVARIRRGNRQLYSVRVLTPGGPHNDAWQVNELLVDVRDGRMVPAFQHGPSGYGFDGPEIDPPAPDDTKLIRVPLPPFKRAVPMIDRSAETASAGGE